MAKTLYILGIVLLFSTMYSCSSKESLVQSPSFLAANNLPDKPSYENNDEFDEYYSANYESLTPANMERVTEDQVNNTNLSLSNPNFNVNQYLSPSFSFGVSFGTGFGCNPFARYNYHNPFYDPFYDPYGLYGFGTNSLYSNYLYGCGSSFWYGNSYYSRYYNGFYWGMPSMYPNYGGYAHYGGSHDDNYYKPFGLAPTLPMSSYTAQSVTVPYTKTSSPTKGKINYAKPVSKPKKQGAVKTGYKAKTSYNYTTNKRTTQKSGYYRPPTAPVGYGYPTGGSSAGRSSGHGSGSSSSRSNYQPKRTASSPGYRPPSSGGGSRPSGGGGGMGSRPSGGGGSAVPTRSNSSGATPRR